MVLVSLSGQGNSTLKAPEIKQEEIDLEDDDEEGVDQPDSIGVFEDEEEDYIDGVAEFKKTISN